MDFLLFPRFGYSRTISAPLFLYTRTRLLPKKTIPKKACIMNRRLFVCFSNDPRSVYSCFANEQPRRLRHSRL